MGRIGLRLAAAMLALHAQAFAASHEAVAPEKPVPGRPGLAYADLLREVAPYRNILGPDFGGEPPDRIAISDFDAVRFEAGGRARLALLVDLGESEGRVEHTALLALFDVATAPELLDLVDVGMDASTSVSTLPQARLGPGDEPLAISGQHSNSNQTYATYALVFVRDDRWRLIGTFSTLSDRSCAFERDEAANISARRAKSGPYADLVVAVRETQKRSGADCGPDQPRVRNYVRDYRATYRWDPSAQRFATDSKALKRLQEPNEKRD